MTDSTVVFDNGRWLRCWRDDVADLSLAELAERMTDSGYGISRQAISHWENNKRQVDHQAVHALDRAFGARGTFEDLWRAAGTPNGLPPKETWQHNFRNPGGSAWAWVRPSQPGNTTIRASIGPFQRQVVADLSRDGAFLWAASAVANPATTVTVEGGGWVDFGRGIPPTGLGIPRWQAIDKANVADGESAMIRVARDAMTGMLGGRRELLQDIAREAGEHTDVVNLLLVHEFDDGEEYDEVSAVANEELLAKLGWQPKALRKLRIARGYSQRELAQLVTDLDRQHPVSEDQMQRFEAGRSDTTAVGLRARLDILLDGDGDTFTEPVSVRKRSRPDSKNFVGTPAFPSWWIGPVWVQFTHKSRRDIDRAPAQITWGPWRKRLAVTDGAVVWFRKSSVGQLPPSITVSSEWLVTAGIGRRSDAVDVNADWRPVGPREATDLLLHYQAAFLRTLGRSQQELGQLLARLSRRTPG